MKTVLKWLVAVDDRPYAIGGGKVVLVGPSENPATVYVWTEEELGYGNDQKKEIRLAQVYGTGHKVPDEAQHLGSTQTVLGLVWHVYEVPSV